MNELYKAIVTDLTAHMQNVLQLQSLTGDNNGTTVNNGKEHRDQQEVVVREARAALTRAKDACAVAEYYGK